MSRYTGPRSRVSRRLGVNVWGTKGETIALERRPYPPGEHGRSRRRGNVSEYLLQLQEKQKARYTYGLTERQFRNIFKEAARYKGVTGPQARQLVSHGHINVNGSRVDIPSYRLRKDDVVSLRDKAQEMIVVGWNLDVLDRTPPAWLSRADNGFEATVRDAPLREQIDVPVREQLIVELYSK